MAYRKGSRSRKSYGKRSGVRKSKSSYGRSGRSSGGRQQTLRIVLQGAPGFGASPVAVPGMKPAPAPRGRQF